VAVKAPSKNGVFFFGKLVWDEAMKKWRRCTPLNVDSGTGRTLIPNQDVI
jgi:hypothetical protein